MDYRVRRLNQYVQGWMGYFRLAHAPEVLRPGRMVSPSAATDPVEGMETAADAVANLRALGVRADLAWQWGMSSRGYWRIAKSRFCTGRCRPAIGRNVVSCSFTQPGPGFERPGEPPDARPARPVV